jgi:hypothetical protein
MSQLSSNSFFGKQNVWVKGIIFVLGSVCDLLVPEKALIYLLITTFAYLLLCPEIIFPILKGIRALLPFLASYAVFAYLFKLSFPDMSFFLLRLVVLLTIVVYFSASLTMQRLLEDIQPMHIPHFFQPVIYFCLSTIYYLKHFILYYQSNLGAINKYGKSPTRLIPVLLDAIHTNWQNRDKIEADTETVVNRQYQRPSFINKNNIWGCLYIAILTLVLSL